MKTKKRQKRRFFSQWPIQLGALVLFTLAFFALLSHINSPSQIPFFESEISSKGFFPRAEPAAVGLNPIALASLITQAQATHSHVLIIIKDGHVVTERYFGHKIQQPLRINSITKGIVSLAIGALINEGKIPGVNTPLSKWFPQWAEGKKAKITLWNILTHTSGLYHEKSAAKLYQQQDVVKYALDLPITDKSGENFSYSNEAVALIPGIVLAASEKPLDICLKEWIFDPMDILNYKWDRDEAGNVMAYGGLWLLPRDLARIGQMMLDAGRWKEKQIVPASWVHAATSPAHDKIPYYGLLWWLYPRQKSQKDVSKNTSGFGGDGWLGQYVVIYPEWHLVAIRMHAIEEGNDDKESKKYGFRSFRKMVLALVQPLANSASSKFKVESH